MNQPSGAVVVAPLGRRFGAAVVDRLVPGLIIGLWYWMLFVRRLDAWLIYSVALGMLLLAWVVLQWWLYATRRAGLGFSLFGLELVRLADGKPIGWGRMCLRTLVSHALWALVLPGIAMVIFLVVHERRMGWHDMAAGSLAIARRRRETAPVSVAQTSGRRNSTVGLPPHLLASSGFSASVDAPPPPAAPIEHVPLRDPVPPVAVPRYGVPSSGPTPGDDRYVPSGHAPVPHPQAQPSPIPVSQPSPAAPVRIRPRRAPSDDTEGTRLVAPPGRGTRPADEGWHVRLDDGRDITVRGLVLIGRNPAARENEAGAVLVPAGEPSRTVSKTHLEVGVDARGIYVTDRGSTNGTALVGPRGELDPCPANTEVRVRDGQVVSFGERQLQVLRHPAARD